MIEKIHEEKDHPVTMRYAVAQKLAVEAGKHALMHFKQRERLTVESKGVQDVVSIADREVESLLRARLATLFPDDAFIGEESATSTRDPNVHRALWVVDPIDGTSCFLNGMYAWCISIAVLIDGEPTIGVVYDPNTGELFHASRGNGAWLRTSTSIDARLSVSAAASAADGVLGLGISHRVPSGPFLDFVGQWLAQGGMFIRNGSGALMLAYTAAGRLIGYYEPHMHAWDCLAGIVLVNEAGGRTNAFLADNGLTKGNAVVAAGPHLYDDLSRIIVGQEASAERVAIF